MISWLVWDEVVEWFPYSQGGMFCRAGRFRDTVTGVYYNGEWVTVGRGRADGGTNQVALFELENGTSRITRLKRYGEAVWRLLDGWPTALRLIDRPEAMTNEYIERWLDFPDSPPPLPPLPPPETLTVVGGRAIEDA